MSEEEIILNENNTLVSTTRIIINGTTYATSNVTSVACGIVEPKRGFPILMIVLGGLTFLGGLMTMINSDGGVPVISFVFLTIGVLWLIGLNPTYTVLLSSSSGQRQVLYSKDKSRIEQIVSSINRAIIARG